MEAAARQTTSPSLHVGLRYARALLATDAEADMLYQRALQSDMSAWPFLRARVQLAYGERLHQQRQDSAARAPLRAAREAFDALGVIPWSERARQQLRATGETSRPRTPEARDQLTPQELQIVQMAAEGLSNRAIGQKLYLSHRTVSSHLYRVFPKLGITSRTELRAVLRPQPPTSLRASRPPPTLSSAPPPSGKKPAAAAAAPDVREEHGRSRPTQAKPRAAFIASHYAASGLVCGQVTQACQAVIRIRPVRAQRPRRCNRRDAEMAESRSAKAWLSSTADPSPASCCHQGRNNR